MERRVDAEVKMGIFYFSSILRIFLVRTIILSVFLVVF